MKLNISVIGWPNCIIFSVSIDTIEMQLSTKNQQDRTKIVCLGLVYKQMDFAVLRNTVHTSTTENCKIYFLINQSQTNNFCSISTIFRGKLHFCTEKKNHALWLTHYRNIQLQRWLTFYRGDCSKRRVYHLRTCRVGHFWIFDNL